MNLFKLLLILMLFASCAAENAAKEVCACYNEVYKLDDDGADKKMQECMQLLKNYQEKFKGTSDEKVFNQVLHNCR